MHQDSIRLHCDWYDFNTLTLWAQPTGVRFRLVDVIVLDTGEAVATATISFRGIRLLLDSLRRPPSMLRDAPQPLHEKGDREVYCCCRELSAERGELFGIKVQNDDDSDDEFARLLVLNINNEDLPELIAFLEEALEARQQTLGERPSFGL